ncbi:MAG: acetate--CoA ligase family protein [Desulfovibrio sp.]|jgi:acetyltransferase|nr:acetate--CoA ligase family protein [Desulfovibrio sp.]
MPAPLHKNISALFAPKSVCVLGASRDPGKIGHILLNKMLQGAFSGKIFPINPYADKILGLATLRKPGDIPALHLPLDLAVICLPAGQVPQALAELGELPARAAIVVSTGFSETGSWGRQLEEEAGEIARRYGIALLGPNSVGLYVAGCGLRATFMKGKPSSGDIGFFSQSGALCAAMFDWAADKNFGFSSFISLGSKVLLDESDMLAYLAEDPATKVIVGYIENVSDGPKFLQCAHSATRKKPVILFKAGRAGARGELGERVVLRDGQDLAYEAAFRQTGIIRATEIEDLFSMAQAFASCALPQGPSMAVVSNGGRIGTAAAEACPANGLILAPFGGGTVETLRRGLPPYAFCRNPVDLLADASPERFAAAAATVLKDPAVHSLLLIAGISVLGDFDGLPDAVSALPNPEHKPILACLMGGEGVALARRRFFECGIPCYSFPEPAIKALGAMYRQSLWKDNHLPVEVDYRHDTRRARAVIEQAVADRLTELGEYHVQEILSAYEIPSLESRLARTSAEAVQLARQCGMPVALKIASPHILHKSEVQGVALNLDSPEKVRTAFMDITARAGRLRAEAYIAGCIVQNMAPKKARELVISFKRDNSFGPMIIFGPGGDLRAFNDVSCRLAPLSLDDVHDMPREIRTYPVLAGLDGEKAVNFTVLEDILLILSRIALEFPEIQEFECNPVLADSTGVQVAGARILLAPFALEKSG